MRKTLNNDKSLAVVARAERQSDILWQFAIFANVIIPISPTVDTNLRHLRAAALSGLAVF
jgi:hypothetical protein